MTMQITMTGQLSTRCSERRESEDAGARQQTEWGDGCIYVQPGRKTNRNHQKAASWSGARVIL